MSGTVPLNPDKARAWGEQWRERHAPKYATFAKPNNSQGTTEPNRLSPCVRTILALERQINGGQQLSQVLAPVSEGEALLEPNEQARLPVAVKGIES